MSRKLGRAGQEHSLGEAGVGGAIKAAIGRATVARTLETCGLARCRVPDAASRDTWHLQREREDITVLTAL